MEGGKAKTAEGGGATSAKPVKLQLDEMPREDLVKQIQKQLMLLQKAKGKCDALTQKCSTLEQEVKQLKDEKEKPKNVASRPRTSEVEDLREKADTLTVQIQAIRSMYEEERLSHQTTRQQLQQRMNETEGSAAGDSRDQALQEAMTSLAEEQSAHARTVDTASRLQEELEAAQSQKTTLTDENRRLNELIDQLRAEVERSQSAAAEERSSRQGLNQELSALQQASTVKNEETASLHEKIRALSIDVETFRAAADEHRAAYETTRVELETMTKVRWMNGRLNQGNP